MMEKTIQIQWEGKNEEVIVGEISWAIKKKCIKNSIKEVQKGRNMVKEVDPVYQKELMMLASIQKAPFPLEVSSLDKLKSKDGDKIYQAYTEINELDETPVDQTTGESQGE